MRLITVVTGVLSLIVSATSVLAFPEPGFVTGDTRVHDPTLCKDSSGTYFVFCTWISTLYHRYQSSSDLLRCLVYYIATGTGLEIRTSPDRTHWTYLGTVWNPAPAATNQFTGTSNGVLWAPDCTYVDGTFHLFYAASSLGSRNSGIFYATSTTGKPGSFVDHGLVLSTNDNDQYNAIDPNLLITSSGQWYLSWGSFWTGIKQSRLNIDGSVADPNFVSLAQRTGGTDAEEASATYYYQGNYYLFTSWDKCCSGTSSTYNIRVGRSGEINGPYTDQSGVALLNGGGTQILATHDNIYGPGGQDLFTDTDGPILVYHWYNATASYLGINKLDFSTGWPVVV